MKTEFWLAMSAKKSRYNETYESSGVAKVSKNKPTVGPNTVAVKVDLEIPDAYFERPQFNLLLKLPEPPKKDLGIHPELQDDLEEAISEEMGVKVHLSVEKQ